MAFSDAEEKRAYALDLLRNAPVDSAAFDAACDYLHFLFISSNPAI